MIKYSFIVNADVSVTRITPFYCIEIRKTPAAQNHFERNQSTCQVCLAIIIYSCIFHHKQNNRINYFGSLRPSNPTVTVGVKTSIAVVIDFCCSSRRFTDDRISNTVLYLLAKDRRYTIVLENCVETQNTHSSF